MRPSDKGAELAGGGISGWEGDGCCVRVTGRAMSAAEGQASFSAPELPARGPGRALEESWAPRDPHNLQGHGGRGVGWSVGSHLGAHPELLQSGPVSQCCLGPRGCDDDGRAAASKAAHAAPQPGAPAISSPRVPPPQEQAPSLAPGVLCGAALSPLPSACFTSPAPVLAPSRSKGLRRLNEPPGPGQIPHARRCRQLHPWLPPLGAAGPSNEGEESQQVSPHSTCAALDVLYIPLANKHLSGVYPAFPREQTFRQGSAI